MKKFLALLKVSVKSMVLGSTGLAIFCYIYYTIFFKFFVVFLCNYKVYFIFYAVTIRGDQQDYSLLCNYRLFAVGSYQ